MQEADSLDRAAEWTAQMTDASVANLRLKASPEQVQRPDGSWPHTECVDCDDEIPEGRLRLGKIRCVYCQARKERR